MTAPKNVPLPFKLRYRRFSHALMSALAAMALAACGGGGDAADDGAIGSAPSSPQHVMSATVTTVSMTKVSFNNSDGQAGAHHTFDQTDLNKALASPYTAADQPGQAGADAAVMNRLAALFPTH